MKLWTIRAGRYGEQEQTCINEGLVTISWNDLPDLKKFKTRDELFEEFQKHYPDPSNVKTGINVGQVWRFVNEIANGDLVALPSKSQPTIHIGKVTGDYKYERKDKDGEVIHWRPVKWLKSIPRVEFDQDLLYSFGSLLTVSQVSRTQAAERALAMIEGKKATTKIESVSIEEVEEEFDIERIAKDQISKQLDRKFKGHGFAKLIEQILKAQGYTTQLSPPGADGGLDILASSGALGFEQPRICVQVKSTTGQVNVNILRELQGVMKNVNAEHGLLVSWSGFNGKVISEAKEKFFFIRLWTADDIIENIFTYYDKFSDEMKADLSLKRFWMLANE
ncbi:MAG: restriction endonuclease [Chitinophagales bacterium]|nr:restriction endonuclease [Chitinophagales bacterium]